MGDHAAFFGTFIMGLTITDITMLLELRRRNVPIARIATIGSLSLYLHPRQVEYLRQVIPNSSALSEYRWGDKADSFLCEVMGANEVASVDMSNYQESSIVHDMNVLLSERLPELAGKFDLVIDGGTLEHVFNFPVAIANMMFLVSKGGHILTANPANNLCGHGFYQLTPELMYRIYSKANGFRIEHVLLTQTRYMAIEMDPQPRSYAVIDPALIKRRIMVWNRWPLMIRTLAERVGDTPLEGLNVQQSDYVLAWSGTVRSTPSGSFRSIIKKVFLRFPRAAQSQILDLMNRSKLGNSGTMRKWGDW